MKPYERAVRCADEALADEESQLPDRRRKQEGMLREAALPPIESTHTAPRRTSHRRAESAEVQTVTQITADDILSEQGPIALTATGEAVLEEKVEEDVAIINPSVESMDSRG